ncbi:hypothetical protein JIQ42_02929 [Leishmania sp. Namibia]|uniref:hypothetical protein n=1 Tax=Leishmania sp. Namibia TaxID=2802991 RepID=UPI001B68DB1B|nr:hypothetical protein JIQ42_02929 [Leishmania sp. Namibia]
MLAYQVHSIHAGALVYRCVDSEGATLSVSGDREVTLRCAGGLTSHSFPFDEVVFVPFCNILYSCCVADGLRLQFGAALQRPAPSVRDVPRRATVVHGDPSLHVGEAFLRGAAPRGGGGGAHRWRPSLAEPVRVRLQRGARVPVGREGPSGGGGADALSRLAVTLGDAGGAGGIAV